MGRACTICSREDRDAIEQRLVSGERVRAVAREFGVGRDALMRHHAGHLPSDLVGLREAGERIATARAADRLEDLYRRANGVLEAAEAEGRHPIALQAVRELRGIVELLARLSGELESRPDVVVNITASSEWIELQTTILVALEPFPDARQALAAAIAPMAVA
jgi:transposase-like protein